MGRTEFPSDSLKGIHVLLVEDDEDSRSLLARTIASLVGRTI